MAPDEPFHPGDTHAQIEADHWAALEHKLQGSGILTTGVGLSSLPHDVELSDRLRRPSKPPHPGTTWRFAASTIRASPLHDGQAAIAVLTRWRARCRRLMMVPIGVSSALAASA